MKTNITFCIGVLFPSDTVWVQSGTEIVGYSLEKNLHIVIEDGLCLNEKWGVHVYSPTNSVEHRSKWLPNDEHPRPWKYLGDEDTKLVEEYFNFDSHIDTNRLKQIIDEIPSITIKK